MTIYDTNSGGRNTRRGKNANIYSDYVGKGRYFMLTKVDILG